MKGQRQLATAPDTGGHTQLKREQRHLHTHIHTEGLLGQGRRTDGQADNEKRQTGDRKRERKKRERRESEREREREREEENIRTICTDIYLKPTDCSTSPAFFSRPLF
jgi:hypothetical protein